MTRDWAVACALVVFVLVAFAPFVFGPYTLQDSVSSTSSLYPTGSRQPADGNMSVYRTLDPGAAAWQTEPEFVLEHAVVFGEHVLPMWNPYSAYGTPLLANMQSQPLTPVAWTAISSPTALAYDFWVVLRIIVAALLAYAYGRLFVGRAAAFCGGICYAFSGVFLLYLTMPELSVDVVAPALFVAIEMQSRRSSIGAVVAIAFAAALSIFGGMPEQTFLFFIFAGLYAVVRRAVVGTLLGLLFGSCLAAVLVLPFLEYVGRSYTAHGSASTVGLATDGSVLPLLSTYVAPLLFGPPYESVFKGFSGSSGVRDFFGPVACILALSSVLDLGRASRTANPLPKYFFAAIFVILLGKRFGVPGLQLFGQLPIFRQITLYKYDEPLMAFCVAVLVAYAVERITSGANVFWALICSSTVILALLSIVSASYGYEASQAHDAYYFGSLLVSLVEIAAIVALGLLGRYVRVAAAVRQRACIAIVIVGALGSYFIPMYYFVEHNPRRSVSTLRGAPYVFAAKDSLTQGRRFFSPDSLLYPQWSAAFAIPDVRAVDALYDGRYLPFVRAFLKSDAPNFLGDRFVGAPGLDFSDANVRHWMQLSSIGTIGVENPYRGLDRSERFYDDGTVRLYRMSNTTPVVAAFTRVVHVATSEKALEILADSRFDPTTTAVVEDSAGDVRTAGEKAPFVGGSVEIADSTYERAKIVVRRASFVVATMTNYPGWQAFVDGSAARIVPANYLFRGVYVSAGSHILEFRYAPKSLAIGGAISAVTFSLAIVALTYQPFRRRRRMAIAGR